MRFVDFLRTAVLLFAGAATVLALLAVIGAGRSGDRLLLWIAFGWWLGATAIGAYLGRREQAFAGVARMMATARATPALPELEPGAVLINRLWGLAGFTLVAGGLGLVLPQIPAIAVGFPLIAALALRKQAGAVQAVEDRDGVRFYLERTSPLRPTELLRTPGFKKWVGVDEGARERQATRQV